jgi:hypothetical protein
MILTFKGPPGSTVNLEREGEIQGYELLGPPIEYRLLRDGSPISEWTPGVSGFISLLRPVVSDNVVGTRGLEAAGLAIETRGLAGNFTLLVWTRE